MKEFIELILPLIMLWVLISTIQFIIGTSAAVGKIRKDKASCDSNMYRIEYVFPAFRAGCWILGEVK
jgi:hypothetical protein